MKLADTVFPGAFEPELLRRMRASLDKVEKERLVKDATPVDEAVLMDRLVQMNMGEIRTRLHMELLAPAMSAFAPEDRREVLHRVLNGLAHDEIVHIGYIARTIEQWCENGDSARVERLYSERLRDFHVLTIDQTRSAVEAFGQGCFPDLLEI